MNLQRQHIREGLVFATIALLLWLMFPHLFTKIILVAWPGVEIFCDRKGMAFLPALLLMFFVLFIASMLALVAVIRFAVNRVVR